MPSPLLRPDGYSAKSFRPPGQFPAAFERLVATALLWAAASPQAAAVSADLPFTIVLLLGCYTLVRRLMSEPRGAATA